MNWPDRTFTNLPGSVVCLVFERVRVEGRDSAATPGSAGNAGYTMRIAREVFLNDVAGKTP